MIKLLRYVAFIGGLAVTLLGIIILLNESETGKSPENLVNLTLALVFLTGISGILYLVRNKGI